MCQQLEVNNFKRRKRRKRLTLEPQIIQYLLDKGKCNIDDLINFLHNNTSVEKEKINFRLQKMALQKKLKIKDKSISLECKKRFLDDKYDESFEKGPIKLARKGNIITLQSDWQQDEHEQFINSVKTRIPQLKEELDKKLETIEKVIVEEYDPLEVLASATLNNLIVDPETYSESSFEGKQLNVEVIQNIILKNELEKYTIGIKSRAFEKIEKMVEEYYDQLTTYIMFENTNREKFSKSEKEVHFRVLLNFLFIRGHAYPQHYKGISCELFSLLEETLKQKGFVIEDYWSTVDEIQKQIHDKLNKPLKMLQEEHSKFRS